MLKCTKCLEDKHEDEFKLILQRGKRVRQKMCARCIAEYKREHYLKNAEKIKEKARQWKINNPERAKDNNKKWYERNKERISMRAKENASKPEVRARIAERFREYRKNPEFAFKEKARSAVNHAIRDGKLVNPNKCSVCLSEGYSEAHHYDYSKELDVVWVCKQCHENIHHSNEGHDS